MTYPWNMLEGDSVDVDLGFLGAELPLAGPHSCSSSGVLYRHLGTLEGLWARPHRPLRKARAGWWFRLPNLVGKCWAGPGPGLGETPSVCFVPTPALPAGAWTGRKRLFITCYLPGPCSVTQGRAHDLAMGVPAGATDASPGGPSRAFSPEPDRTLNSPRPWSSPDSPGAEKDGPIRLRGSL